MKKKQFFGWLTIGIATILYSCTSSGTQETTSQESVSPTDTLAVTTVLRHVEDSTGTYEITINFPNATSKNPLTIAIYEWISEQLGGTYNSPNGTDYILSLTDTTAFINHYFAQIVESNHKTFAEQMEDFTDTTNEIRYYDASTIQKLDESSNWVTFYNKREVYLGGAHGGCIYFGQTFRKSDGRRIGWDIFTNTSDAGFNKLQKEGLMDCWELQNESELENHLMGNASSYYIPLPQCPPMFTKKGVCFVYNQYEIAAYAFGLPTFIVSYDKLTPYLMVTGKRLINQSGN